MTRRQQQGPFFRVGRYSGPVQGLDREDTTIWCYLCGRPQRPGESLRHWRIRAVRPSPRYHFEFRLFCPAHFGEPEE